MIRARSWPRGIDPPFRRNSGNEIACGSRESYSPASPAISSSRHGQMPNDSGFGHGMCQKVMIVAPGKRSRIMRRQECEVIILDQNHRVLRFALPRIPRRQIAD